MYLTIWVRYIVLNLVWVLQPEDKRLWVSLNGSFEGKKKKKEKPFQMWRAEAHVATVAYITRIKYLKFTN